MRPLVFPTIEDDTILVTTPNEFLYLVTTIVGAGGDRRDRPRKRETILVVL